MFKDMMGFTVEMLFVFFRIIVLYYKVGKKGQNIPSLIQYFPIFSSIYGHEDAHIFEPIFLNPNFRQFMGTNIRDAHIYYGCEPQTHIVYGSEP